MHALRASLLVVAVGGLLFGLLTGVVTGAAYDSARVGVGTGVGVGLLFGLLSGVAVGAGMLLLRRGAAAREQPVRAQEASVAVTARPDLPDRIVAVLRALPAEVTDVDVAAGRFAAVTAAGRRSWGNDVVVQLTGHRDAPIARVTSTPRGPGRPADQDAGLEQVHTVAQRLAG
ncbi:hypothetical protein GB931_11355 [Modestobacter sp. I12A-02628]|uniref:Uncharacterized protein n=1 Tax=Goekera deserti TaxID=2497753 RepID=A0A7K3WC89_9ACTN|nr:hypothetical protein [Goekera deserti]MPQ98503.1 hypothetical protein [Goekera deserti]NDI48333.1 hypothetical protein [Goekera deserti]NEL54082.1 hypothetical protein [Goekera deserti]